MITINENQIRRVRSKLKVSPTAFEETLPEGTTMVHVAAVDAHRADFLEACIRSSADMAASTLIGDDETSGFRSTTLIVPMGEGCTANVIVKPHGDGVAAKVVVDTTLTTNSEGILSGTDYLTNLVKNRMAAE